MPRKNQKSRNKSKINKTLEKKRKALKKLHKKEKDNKFAYKLEKDIKLKKNIELEKNIKLEVKYNRVKKEHEIKKVIKYNRVVKKILKIPKKYKNFNGEIIDIRLIMNECWACDINHTGKECWEYMKTLPKNSHNVINKITNRITNDNFVKITKKSTKPPLWRKNLS